MVSRLSCVLPQTGELLWEVPEYDQRCMVFSGNNIYIGNGDGTVMGISQKTGQVKYERLDLSWAAEASPLAMTVSWVAVACRLLVVTGGRR